MHTEKWPKEQGLSQWDEAIVEPGARMITKLTHQKKDPDRVSVFLDGAFCFGLPHYIVVKYMLRKGMHISEAMQENLLREDQLARAKIKALDFLSYRARTEHEVAEKLRSKEFDEAIITQVIERFKELRYLDDEQYARLYAYSRLRSKGRGPRRIQSELQRRGVDKNLIEAALVQLEETENFVQAVRPRAQKRWEKLRKEANPHKRRQKLFDFLLRQGFDFHLAHQVHADLQQADTDAAATADLAPHNRDDIEDQDEAAQSSEEEQRLNLMPYAEKRWQRLRDESDPFKRRKKWTDSMLRKGASYAMARLLLEELQQADTTQHQPNESERPMTSQAIPHEHHEDEDLLHAIRPIAEKRWERLASEKTDQRRRQKLTEFLRRREFSFDVIRLMIEDLEAKDAAQADQYAEEADDIEAQDQEEVDPLDAIRPLAQRRWERLCKSESNTRKRQQKLTDYLRRQGFSFDQISPIFEELE